MNVQQTEIVVVINPCVWKAMVKVFVLIVVKLRLLAHSTGMMTQYYRVLKTSVIRLASLILNVVIIPQQRINAIITRKSVVHEFNKILTLIFGMRVCPLIKTKNHAQ